MENDKVIEIMQNCLTYGGSCDAVRLQVLKYTMVTTHAHIK